jgi:hypothetical protein
MIGVKTRKQMKVIRTTWEMVIREGISVERLTEFLQKIPEKAVICSFEAHTVDPDLHVIVFEMEEQSYG